MTRTIWTLWLQGRAEAPPLVQRCIASWEALNPGWDVRCLDASTVGRYIPLGRFVDLDTQVLSAAALSDVIRMLLLREYGGVWVDATVFCNRPLDAWLSPLMTRGFFAFSTPWEGRPVSSWFIAAEPHNRLMSFWCSSVVRYWQDRKEADEYFWVHRRFADMLETNHDAARDWAATPRIDAVPLHGLQSAPERWRDIDRNLPVFKLNFRTMDGSGSSPLAGFLDQLSPAATAHASPAPPIVPREDDRPGRFASLKVSTNNLGDHLQILAALDLQARFGIVPSFFVDRDDALALAPPADETAGPVGILLNGWFKRQLGDPAWPPHPAFAPALIGFHLRVFQCPALAEPASIEYLKRHGPIGCRDPYTQEFLSARGVQAYLSHCLSLSFHTRIEDSAQTEIFVVSRDERIRDYIPAELGPYIFVNQYSPTQDFEENLARAGELLETYRRRARLVVTTLLHAALPAIAMGIPVVVFFPPNAGEQHRSDQERFSGLAMLTPLNHLNDLTGIDWRPPPVAVGELKLALLDAFQDATRNWHVAPVPMGSLSSRPPDAPL